MNSNYIDLINHIDDLIVEKSYQEDDEYVLYVDDLNEDEIGYIAAKFLEIDNRNTEDCFQNPQQSETDNDITCALIKLLKDVSWDNKENLGNLIFNQTIEKYRERTQELINERCAYVKASQMRNEGYFRYHDTMTNEISWRKHA